MNASLFALFVGVSIFAIATTQATDQEQLQRPSYERARRPQDPKYTYENVRSLAIQDMMRWVTILEDMMAEHITRNFMEGVLDKKSVKIGLRFLYSKLLKLMKDSGIQESLEEYGIPAPMGFQQTA